MVQATAYIVKEKGSPFERITVELEEIQSQEVLVDLQATGICHTDLAVQHGKIPMPFPVILGHEGAGIVREIGSAVTNLAVGDHVVLSFSSCSECRSCNTEKPWQCLDMHQRNFGGRRPDGSQTITPASGETSTCFFGQSSFCNPAVVQQASCVKVDNNLPLPALCSLGCGFQTGAGSVFNVVQPIERKSRHIAIFGVGGVGATAIMAAHILMQENPGVIEAIVAIDLVDERLALAKQLGATHVINSKSQDLEGKIAEVTNGDGLDAAIDCTGVIPVVNSMVSLVGAGGVAVTVGGPSPGLQASIDVFEMLIKCKTYCGTHQGNSDSKTFIPFMVKLMVEGKLSFERLQKYYNVTDINQAASDMEMGLVVKPVLLWE
ncbi:Polyketide synthase, enoylreductase [Penicillium expansum]|uniref:Polyketide synthase, enoylreductase n=1 Tax=Penicillium expansum TaxID=27334 RepID=A0A0A2IJM2_PENEN|nr:Polyketide synthase, enoylreductase [Penicillium expansum]KGO40465.1 Polyketide synthase, enoylreductase [Penicillium expansum]KGO59689.1 Polyketide synthase, enoylreductase [Penicillium expansum]KGO66355.1 Polyketide synthase, enoylreductase [Penicillium expansum]